MTKIGEKNAALRVQINKLEHQLKKNEESGADTLQAIDFHQLQIENNQYNQKIEERNDEFVFLMRLAPPHVPNPYQTLGGTAFVLMTLSRRFIRVWYLIVLLCTCRLARSFSHTLNTS